MLKVENISLRAGTFELSNISFEVSKGDYFVILGVSGVGKSLLLESIAGLLNTTAGKIYLRGKEISEGKIQKRKISIVYQDSDLFPHLTVFENIAYPLKSKKERGIKEKVLKAAEQVGIEDKLNRKPETLSGGEYQRVSLARSLAAGNDIFLLDEPLASLDSKSKSELRQLLRKLNREGITIIHVTHDYEEAISLANKIGVMEKGALVHIASPEEVFHHPKSEFVAHFIGTKNFFKGNLKSLSQSDLKEFTTKNLKIYCLTNAADGESYLTILPEEISLSNEIEKGSSRNHFNGKIIDIAPAKLGFEIFVDAGVELIAIVSGDSKKDLQLDIGKKVWVNFKAASCKVYK
ncbi:MAG: molybdate/tungstate transport system ATP-binding protein [Ignavibacteria bacterium]|nr:MAG: molybdate/tungstate transport system ATP-binding protein [Ignavibacteria bacterium]KAF0160677.1 MAG: molybdate/tungstate transport system ATP-binding protein [Ignavibacteria bacterium]